MFQDFIRLVDTKGQTMSAAEIEELLTFKSQTNILSVSAPDLMSEQYTLSQSFVCGLSFVNCL